MNEHNHTEIDLATAAGHLPGRGGRSPHVLTVKRWIMKGVNGVRLQASRCGGTWFTTLAAIEQFKKDCTSAALPAAVQTARVSSGSEMTKRQIEARKFLQENGFNGTQDASQAASQAAGRAKGHELPAVRKRRRRSAGRDAGAVPSPLHAIPQG